MVQMRDHSICFYAEITKIIRNYQQILLLIYHLLLSPSLWEAAQYRLKYCLKGPLSTKTTNQPSYLELCLSELSWQDGSDERSEHSQLYMFLTLISERTLLYQGIFCTPDILPSIRSMSGLYSFCHSIHLFVIYLSVGSSALYQSFALNLYELLIFLSHLL